MNLRRYLTRSVNAFGTNIKGRRVAVPSVFYSTKLQGMKFNMVPKVQV
jgi:hypothetical protein